MKQCSVGFCSDLLLSNASFFFVRKHPTIPFTILEPQNPWIDVFYELQERRATYYKAPKLGKGSSGTLQNGIS